MKAGNTRMLQLLSSLYFSLAIFYFSFGIFIYLKDRLYRINRLLFIVCLTLFLWTASYGLMFVSPTIQSANFWRTISSIASCFFFPYWLELMLEIKNQGKNRLKNIWRYSLIYSSSHIFNKKLFLRSLCNS
jgi:hypothetical protein